jgi:integrase/recombinase XerD
MIIANLLDEYLEHLQSRNLGRKTISHQRNAVSAFLQVNRIGEPADVVPADIRRFEEKLLEDGLASGTKRFKLGAVRDFLLFLRARGLVLFDASALFVLPKMEKPLPRVVLTEEEIKRLLALPMLNRVKGLRMRAIVEVFYGTGIRRQELLNLDLYDLDMRERTLLVRQGKGGKDRILPVPRTTLKYVKEYIETVRARRRSRRRALFVDRGGDRLDDNELQGTIRYLGRVGRTRLGIGKPITCHVFRHSIATHLVRRGVDIRYVQAFLGHADLATTQIYTRVAAAQAAREVLRAHPREKMKIPLRRGVTGV